MGLSAGRSVGSRSILLATTCAIVALPALAQTPSGGTSTTQRLEEIDVVAPHPQPPRRRPVRRAQPAPQPARTAQPLQTQEPATGAAAVAITPPLAASEVSFTGAEINARPLTRPGEALEAVPGLIVTQHSGEGKANQYFLRGYNLDHGTDLAITVDDMPINMRTHAHGQGYADLNFLIPELIGAVDARKGPYFADEGDFASAGAVHVGLVDSLVKQVAQITVGSFGYRRVLGMGSSPLGGGTLLYAGEAASYNGPWSSPDEVRKLNGVLRYSQGTPGNGFSLTGMAYDNRWNSTDQVPQRAIASGQIGLFDALDPSDGGNSSRLSLSGRFAQTDDNGAWRGNAYAVKSTLDLYNNFTYFLADQTNGDQFHQHDDRLLVGGAVSRTINGAIGALPTETTFGLQTRYDDIKLALTNTVQRQFLSNIRSDLVNEGSVGVYAENTIHWTGWLRTTLGWRGDVYSANVNSIFDAANSGQSTAAIGSPKFGMVVGPFYKTELFLSAGMGFHSNDVRGVTITEDPADPTTKLNASPFLVRTKGAEVGLRSKIVPGLTSSISVFVLDQASEILFSGDAGGTEPSRPSERVGIEWTNEYRPVPWFALDADVAVTRARFIGGFDFAQQAVFDQLAGFPQAQIGNAPGDFIPGAPAVVASAGITLGGKTGWFGALRYRYLGPRPLTEDGAFVSPATSLVNGQVGYRFENGWRVQLDAYNIFDSRTDQITYAYGSLLRTDTLFAMCYPSSGAPTAPAAVCGNGVMDRVLHPVEPLALRLTVAGAF